MWLWGLRPVRVDKFEVAILAYVREIIVQVGPYLPISDTSGGERVAHIVPAAGFAPAANVACYVSSVCSVVHDADDSMPGVQ